MRLGNLGTTPLQLSDILHMMNGDEYRISVKGNHVLIYDIKEDTTYNYIRSTIRTYIYFVQALKGEYAFTVDNKAKNNQGEEINLHE